MSNYKPLARKADIVMQDFSDETLIYDLNTNKAIVLNETSSMIWQLCDGKNTIHEISTSLEKKFKESVSQDLIWLALKQFDDEKLLEEKIEIETPISGLSRREVIKKIGFASILALPIVSSLVAPSSIHAASCVDPNNNMNTNFAGCPCVGNNDCQMSCCGFGNVCANLDSVPAGGSCRVNCECQNLGGLAGCCGGPTFGCVPRNSAVMGDPCGADCQCIGASSCVGMICT